jgi:hypothetical protein
VVSGPASRHQGANQAHHKHHKNHEHHPSRELGAGGLVLAVPKAG